MTSPAAYAAIKGGLVNLTRYFAAYYGPFQVRANCISPGGIFDHQPEVFVNNYCNKVPMKRMGNPEDVVPAIHFLLADETSYLTGQNIIIDGGWSII
jgi:NAD(P)-dependent dehydrogenase (short-subunit alcohol dehydrogenase family)